MSENSDKQALLVIDVQAGFISDYTKRALPGIYELVRGNEQQVIIATRFLNEEGSPFRKYIKWNRLSSDADRALDPVVESHADLIINKPTYGAGAQIATELVRRGIKKVTVIGIDTDVCVLQNAAFLFDAGFEVSIDLHACATNGGPQAEVSAVRLLQRTIGRDYVLNVPAATLET